MLRAEAKIDKLLMSSKMTPHENGSTQIDDGPLDEEKLEGMILYKGGVTSDELYEKIKEMSKESPYY